MGDTDDDGEASWAGLPIARDHPTVTFLLLAFGLSWGVWVPAALETATFPGAVSAGVFGPLVAAVVATVAVGGSVRGLLSGLLRWRVAPRWYLVALGVPVGMLAVMVPGYVLIGGTVDLSVLSGRLVGYPFLLLAMVLLGGGQEELGWRGFALPRLQGRFGPLRGTLVLGLVWAAWHWPLFAIEGSGYGELTLPVHGATVVGMAVLLSWVYNGSGGSVLLAMLLHGSINAAGFLMPVGREILQGSPLGIELLQMASLWVLALAAVAAAGRSLGSGQAVTVDSGDGAGDNQGSASEPPSGLDGG
jgi:membrane protease YdiL (CAAX protease family)